jgi:hypothetical protein
MIYVAVPFIVYPGLSSLLTQLEETSASTIFCWMIMLDDPWSKMSALAKLQKVAFVSNLHQSPFVVEEA